jgi:deazaflavin-dependent oxidoreductase (nitroreductase family)
MDWNLIAMDEKIKFALERDRTIDITTIGRKSGKPRRIEIWFYRAKGRVYLSGSPGKRSWYANLRANPAFTFHLKESVLADLPAKARPVIAMDERREIFRIILNDLGVLQQLEKWVANSPLVEVDFDGLSS